MQEEEAAAGEEFPLEIKESQPSRWAQTERGGMERKRPREEPGTAVPTVHPSLCLRHKLEPAENNV